MVAIKKVDLGTSASPKTIVDTSVYKVKLLSFRIVVVAKIRVPIRLSERRDSNPRYPAPKAGGIATIQRSVYYSNTQDSNLVLLEPSKRSTNLNYITIG